MDSNRDYCVIILIIRDDNEAVVMLANYHHTVSSVIKVPLAGVPQYFFDLLKTETSQFSPILYVI